ncbi:MAG: type II secretion system major pseudopilin GspG [Panacagrimonas sp.]
MTAFFRKRPAPALSQGGFTLIEIMVVVVILGILAAVVVPRIMDRPDEARIARAKQDIRALEAALNLYKLDNFNYPSTQQGLEALVSEPSGEPEAKNWKSGGYIAKLPNDPWSNPYQYLSPGVRGEIDVFSLGADGRPGGDASATDIGNWDLGN